MENKNSNDGCHKIMFLTWNYSIRGGAISLFTLISFLKERGDNVELIIGRHGEAETIEQNYGFSSRYIKQFNWMQPLNLKTTIRYRLSIARKKTFNLWAEQRLYYAIKKFNPDVVIINSSDCYVGIKSCNRLRIPVVMYFREFMTLDHGRRYWSESFAKKYFSKLDGGIAISNAIKQYFTKYDIPNLEIIYNGIDEKKYKLPKADLSKSIFKISCVGKLSDGKNQVLALKAVVLLLSKGITNFHVYFYGDNFIEYKNYLEDFIKENSIEEFVSLVGPTNDISEMYSDAHINLLCSKNEAFGRVIIEGMMNKCLNIVSNSGGAIEIIQDKINGLLFESDNAEALCNTLIYGMENYCELNGVIEQGYHDALQNYTSEKNVENLEEYLKMLCSIKMNG